jgi:Terminase large subunit, T4likevirus-type, N-terminal
VADVVWEPTPKQAEFLACPDFEALYGGAAGGGKSDALLVDSLCLQHNGIGNPNHRAILFRRSFPELRDLIDRSREIYEPVSPWAKYNQQDKLWVFPSGAKLEFGYLQHDSDRFKYRGRAWNYIGFDELTLWPTPTCYLYLHSRCRSTDNSLPRYVRAATNPDGPGQKWVMERFGIGAEGNAARIPVDIEDPERGTVTTVFRRFVPAKLDDNRYLAGTGYREVLLQLPPEERDALLKGLWVGNRVKGAYYVSEMAMLRQQGRIRAVPYTPGVPVCTFWDLGWNDTTAIWFHQYVAGEHRFIHAYENSGESLDHYAQYLLSRGYVYHRHYLPHDASNTSLQTGKTNLAVLEALLPGHSFEVVPRTDDVLIGINDTRMAMRTGIYIDAEGCADGVVALDNYSKRYVEKLDVFADEPLHNRYSNYADAFRQWGQGYHPSSSSVRRKSRNRSAMAV